MAPEASDQMKDAAVVEAAGAAEARDPEQWFVYLRSEVIGPFTLAEMVRLVRDGQLNRQAQAARRGSPDWKEAGADELLAPLFAGPEVNRLPTAPSPFRTEPGRLVVTPSRPRAPETPRPVTGPVRVAGKPPMPSPSAPPTRPANATTPPAAPAKEAIPPPSWALSAAGVAAPPAGPAPWDKRGRDQPAVDIDWRSLDQDNDPHPVSSGLTSLVVPGLGQLLNGEVLKGMGFFIGAVILWGISLGWIAHIWAAIDAARRADVIAEDRQSLRIEMRRRSGRKE